MAEPDFPANSSGRPDISTYTPNNDPTNGNLDSRGAGNVCAGRFCHGIRYGAARIADHVMGISRTIGRIQTAANATAENPPRQIRQAGNSGTGLWPGIRKPFVLRVSL